MPCSLVGILVEGCRCETSWFDLDSDGMFSTDILDTYFTYHKAMWIAYTD